MILSMITMILTNYHFIIKELAEEFEGQCFSASVPIEKEVIRISTKGE